MLLYKLYNLKANRALRKDAQQPLIKQFLDPLVIKFLMECANGKNLEEKDLVNWLHANYTVWGQIKNVNWNRTFGGLGGAKGKDYLLLTMEPNAGRFDDNFDSDMIGTLQPSSGIQKINIFQIHREDEKYKPENYPKEYGHYAFLTNMFENYFHTKFKERKDFDIAAKDFILKNQNKLNLIRKQFETEPMELGAGSDGIAYSIGPDKVLKIFRDKVAFEASQAAMDRLWQQPELGRSEAMIYDSGIIGQLSDKYPIYYYIMEKFHTVADMFNVDNFEELLRDIANSMNNYKNEIKILKEYLKKNINIKEVANKIQEIANKITNELKNSDAKELISYVESASDIELKKDWLFRLIFEMVQKVCQKNSGDLHVYNLGLTNNGEFRYFDPSFSELNSKMQISPGEAFVDQRGKTANRIPRL